MNEYILIIMINCIQDLGDNCGNTNQLPSVSVPVTINFESEDLLPPVFEESFYPTKIVENHAVVMFLIKVHTFEYLTGYCTCYYICS